jgi:hypothetical protein
VATLCQDAATTALAKIWLVAGTDRVTVETAMKTPSTKRKISGFAFCKMNGELKRD